MIGDADQDTDRFARRGRPPSALKKIGCNPAIHAALVGLPETNCEKEHNQGYQKDQCQ
jgi:hypothetical protein